MSFQFDGKVLEGVRQSPVNAATTNEPGTAVIRDIRPLPAAFELTAPDLVAASADQYRVAALDTPGSTVMEYLVWAQNSAQLATVDNPDWWTDGGTGDIPTGVLNVVAYPATIDEVTYTDGTANVVVVDEGNRSIGSILWLVIARGDVEYDDDGWTDSSDPLLGREGDPAYIFWPIAPANQNPVSGMVTLTDAQLVLLDGGLSVERGDRIVKVGYTVAPPRFWWTRNDRYEQRFGWNGSTQRWEPWKGSGVKGLGYLLLEEASFTLSPKIKNLPVGAILPGDGTPSGADKYSMIRLGSDPGVNSTPAAPSDDWAGIMVKLDDAVEDFDFSQANTLIAVMGQTNGKLVFNPAYVQLNAGNKIWYSYKGFNADEDGVIGSIQDARTDDLYLAPLPGPTDAPLLRYGNRTYLDTVTFNTDGEMDTAGDPDEGQIYLSLSTGRLVLSPVDLSKVDPDNTATFSKYYFGNKVVYDGVALCQRPQPTKSPVRLVDTNGDFTTNAFDAFLPDSETLPTSYNTGDWNSAYRGLGVSGILQVPDELGALPQLPTGGREVPVRPGGDNYNPSDKDPNIGMVRVLEDTVSDSIIFGRDYAVADTIPYRIPSDKPRRIRGSQAYICLQKDPGDYGSRVLFNRYDAQRLRGDYIYFLQAALTPAIYSIEAKIYSRNRDIFRFDGDEILYFNVDTTDYTWDTTTLLVAYPDNTYFTAEEVAEDMATVTGADVTALNGRIIITGTISVEIGFGGGDKDLTGATVLGFLPGWRAVEGVPCWLPDSGVSVGLSRSPVNLDKSKSTCDFSNVGRIQDGILSDSVQPNPYFFFINAPLQDVAGYDDNLFFRLISYIIDGDTVRVVFKTLDHYEDIIYRFGEKKFDWIAEDSHRQAVEQAITTLSLGNVGVVPETMIGAPGIGGGLYVNSGEGGLVLQTQDDDYILPFDGVPGNATLINRFGRRVQFGAQGSFIAGSDQFTDTTVDFTDSDKEVFPGYRLKITNGDAEGSYYITAVTEHTLTVSPSFLWASDQPAAWELFEGYTKDTYDPMIVADMIYQEFSPLTEEPFQVRKLSYLNDTPADSAAQLTNRLEANIQGALSSDRPINVRYGATAPTDSNTVALTWLTKTDLGVMENGMLVLPDVTSIRFTQESFSIQVGTVVFSHGDTTYPLVGVTAFSLDPGASIEYMTVTDPQFPKGQLKFGTVVLATYAESHVLVNDDFLSATELDALHGEINPLNGELNLSAEDLQSFAGVRAYFVEQMDTQKDLSVQPLSGSVAFLRPLPKGVLVEIEYYAADLEGRKLQYPVLSINGEPTGVTETRQITEFLPVFIRDEVAERESDRVFYFNTDLNNIYSDIDPIIYIRAAQQNYNETNCVVDYMPDGRGRLTFVSYDVTSGVNVKVTYAVAESQGGERAYETSTKPVYRPPFFITADQNRFGLHGDRENEFEAGQLLRFSKENFYVKGTKYYPEVTDSDGNVTGDITAVYIFPQTIQEVGSRAPARDVLTLKTLMPITPVVDPNGDVVGPNGEAIAVSTTAALGLMFEIDITEYPFEPINRGQTDIAFKGNLTNLAVPGHILEFGGIPYTIAGAELSDDGSRTVISIATGIRQAFTVADNPTVKLTTRPVYPPNVADLLGVGQFVPEEGYELVQYGLTDDDNNDLPGKTLVDTVDYAFDLSNGLVTLLTPIQEPLNAPESLKMSFVRLRQLAPYVQEGAIIRPTYSATYQNVISPSEENGLLGATLQGRYTFRNPDSFYFRIVPMTQFLVEVTEEVIKEITSKQPASGAPQPSGGEDNWQQGRIGLKSERRHLMDKDRMARTFLDFYNTTTNAFEQVNETISGELVGDRDGKFKFWIGRDNEWPAPGYEDEITGALTPRNIFTEVFTSRTGAGGYVYTQPYDKLVEPQSFEVSDSEMTGKVVNVNDLHDMMDEQRDLVANEVDDIVMSRYYSWFKRKSGWPFYYFILKGQFHWMYQTQKYSRLFPLFTRSFLRTNPGVDADLDAQEAGFYSAGRYDSDDEYQKTTGNTIAQLANTVVGNITSVKSLFLTKRKARARIWQYLPNGIPEGAFGLVAGSPSPEITSPCLIATPGWLSDFPIDPTTGYPDKAQFLINNGDIPDIETGDPEMAVPPFEIGDQIAWGKPTGRVYDAFCGSNDVDGDLTGVYIESVLYGCVVTFMDVDGAPIINSNNVLVGTNAQLGTPAEGFIELGDTVQSIDVSGTVVISNPPTTEDMELMAANQSDYRPGFDFWYTQDGQILDVTLPSKEDPHFWHLKEIFGQNPIPPLTCLDGVVEFYYDGQNPLLIPALEGDPQDDSGDYHVPFLRVKNTELDRFNEGSVIADVLKQDHLGVGLYPNEWLGNDGTVTTIPVVNPGQENIVPANQPAMLLTATDVDPATLPPGSADLDEYDLLFTQVQGTSPFTTNGLVTPDPGAMGILSVGRITPRTGSWTLSNDGQLPVETGDGSMIEPPRFVTQTKDGSPIRYKIENAMVSEENTGLPNIGVKLRTYDALVLATHYMVLDFTDINIDMSGLDAIYGASPNNTITVKIISHDDPAAVNGPGGAGVPLPGSVILTFGIQQSTGLTITNYVDPAITTPNLTNAQFGVDGAVIGALPGINPADYLSGNTRYILLTFSSLTTPVMDLIWDVPNPPIGLVTRPDWFIPYEVSDYLGDLYTQADYGMDFVFNVDTYNTALLPGESTTAYIDSDRLTFNENIDFSMAKARGTVHPLPGAYPLQTELSIYEVTVGHDGATTYASTINTFCNGDNGGLPVPFTFLPRDGVVATSGSLVVHGFEGYDGVTGDIPIIGNLATFSGVASTDQCKLSALLPIYGSICTGIGKMESSFSAITDADLYDNRVADITIATGAVSSIESGDILVIKQDVNGEATTKAGTYLVRHGISQDTPGSDWHDSSPVVLAGNETGWCPVRFPTIVEYTETSRELVLSDAAEIREIETANAVAGYPATWKSGFPDPTSGDTFIYIIRNVGDLATLTAGTSSGDPEYDAAATAYKESIIRLKYTALSIDVLTGQCTLTLDAILGVPTVTEAAYAGGLAAAAPGDSDNGVISSEADRTALLQDSYQVSGMQAWPVNVSGESYGLPANNVVGVDDGAVTYANGFIRLNIDSKLADTTAHQYVIGDFTNVSGGFAAGKVYPATYEVAINNEFYEDRETPVYTGVVGSVISDIDADWELVNLSTNSIGNAGTWNYYAKCLLPSSRLTLGHRARAGVFLEPSFPRQALNLIGDRPKVVDESDSVLDPDPLPDIERMIGARDSNSYGYVPPTPTTGTPSEVSFEVRRIRRFHDIQNDVNLKLAPLRYVYEIRRGRITAYDWDPTTTNQRGLVSAEDFVMDFDPAHVSGTSKTPDVWNDGGTYTGTNLGTFLVGPLQPNEDVNVHPGDMFRLLSDEDGSVLEEVRIEQILGTGQLQLAAPGLVTRTAAQLAAVGGKMRFEIFLNRAPVPLEQSAEELLELITDQAVYRTDAQYGDLDSEDQGGYVPEMTGTEWGDFANQLKDDSVDGVSQTFSGLGIRKKDIVIIDAAGKIPQRSGGLPYIQEHGMRPIGDMGVVGREGYTGDDVLGNVYDAGLTDPRDDNRGYYRVTKIESDTLTVTGVSTFAGDLNDDVIFGTDSLYQYAVYPTVHGSLLNPVGDERQMDLRPTKYRDATTGKFNYVGNYHSMRPFSYRVIRPSQLFTEETIDLVLMIRDRLLSLMELIGRGFEEKSGDYWTFQKFNHIEDLGATWNAEVGLGLLSNEYILSVLGRVDISPFMNNNSCISILDRRFWVQDSRLDSLTPTETTDNNPYGMKPVETGDVPYTAYTDNIGEQVLPVLPERIEEVLDQRDQFRSSRYVWLAYRTHKILGVLAGINRFDTEYLQRRQEQLENLIKQESLEKLTT